MDLPLDILRFITLFCKVSDLEKLCLVDKSFNVLCNERSLWLQKFEEKNIEIIDDKINKFIEYKKVSYASYIANCLFDLIEAENKHFKRDDQTIHRICWVSLPSKNFLSMILNKNPFVSEYEDEHVYIDLVIRNEGRNKYYLSDQNYEHIEIFFK